jgi:hypothetical protein
MTKGWEDRILFLQAAIRFEFEHWYPFEGEDSVIGKRIMSYTRKKANYRISIVFASRENKYIEISLFEKTKKDEESSKWNPFLLIKKKKFTVESKNEDILRNLQSYKKEIELKELF